MSHYPYSPEMLKQLNILRDDFIKKSKSVIRNYIDTDMHKIKTIKADLYYDDIDMKAKGSTTFVTHNNFLLVQGSVGTSTKLF